MKRAVYTAGLIAALLIGRACAQLEAEREALDRDDDGGDLFVPLRHVPIEESDEELIVRVPITRPNPETASEGW